MRKIVRSAMAASTIAVAASAWAADTQELSAKLNPDILSELRTDEDLAGAPNATRGFGYSYSYEWTGKDPFKSKTAVTYERLPEKGFVLERGAYEEGDGYRRDMRTYFAAGGLLTILETGEVTQPGGKKKPSESHLSNYSISGDLYPVAVGNKFSIKTEMTGTTDWELKEECRVKRKLEASSFDARFTGPAFYVDCRVDVTGGEPGTQDYYYIVELDFFLPDFRDSACSDCKDYRLTLN